MKTKNFPEIAFSSKGSFNGVRNAKEIVDAVTNKIGTRSTFILISLRGTEYGKPGRHPAVNFQPAAGSEPYVVFYHQDGTADTSDGLKNMIVG